MLRVDHREREGPKAPYVCVVGERLYLFFPGYVFVTVVVARMRIMIF